MRSHVNLLDVLELLGVMEGTNFTTLSEQWRDIQSRAFDYHRGLTRRRRDYFFYYPCRRHMIDELSASMRVNGTQIIPDYVERGWVHPEEGVERTLCDDKRDYHPNFWWPHSQFHVGGLLRVNRAQ